MDCNHLFLQEIVNTLNTVIVLLHKTIKWMGKVLSRLLLLYPETCFLACLFTLLFFHPVNLPLAWSYDFFFGKGLKRSLLRKLFRLLLIFFSRCSRIIFLEGWNWTYRRVASLGFLLSGMGGQYATPWWTCGWGNNVGGGHGVPMLCSHSGFVLFFAFFWFKRHILFIFLKKKFWYKWHSI